MGLECVQILFMGGSDAELHPDNSIAETENIE